MKGLILILLILGCQYSSAQELLDQKITSGFLGSITNKFQKLEDKISKKTLKTLRDLKKQEEKLFRKLAKKDSALSKKLLAEAQKKYSELEAKLHSPLDASFPKQLKEYIPFFDTLKTSLSFLDQSIDESNPLFQKLNASKQVLKQFEQRMQLANEIKRQLKERKKMLNDQLEKFGLAKQLKKINKEVFYYQQQLNEYKSLLSDPKKIETKAIALLKESKVFKEFMKKNSMLAKLFGVPDDYGSAASLTGLQTRASVGAMFSSRVSGVGISPQQYFRKQMKQANGELNKLKNKLKNLGGKSGGSDIDMPQGFKPNDQKTKSFFRRLEFGTNFQTQKLNSYFPTTTDVAISVGYKLNDKSVVGIGTSYKLGLGTGWDKIKFTNEGIGLRSFIDWKLKGNLWISGGYEQNYYHRFTELRAIREVSLWRKSGLIGFTKKIKAGKRKGNIQLLYDFLHTQQNIPTQPFIFRVGYSLK